MLRAEIADVGLFSSMARYGALDIHAVLDLRRSFSREQLEGALEAAITAFPVLGRRYEPRFWRDRWRPVTRPLSDSVHVVDAPGDVEALTAAWARRPLDTLRERPLRLVSLRREHGSRVILSLSHLAVDGGGVAAVGHVVGAHLCGVSPSAPVDARRHVGAALEGLRWYHLPALARDLAAAALVPLRTRAAARRERPFPSDPSGEATWRHLVIPRQEVERLKALCKPQGASVNDALLAALARVAAWRSRGGPVAVMYTMDLRRYAGEARLTAANTSAILTAIIARGAIGDLASTAAAVAAVTARHRRGLAGPAFLVGPTTLTLATPHALARRFTKWIHPFVVDLPLGRGLMLTNIGRVDEGLAAFGDDLEDLRIIGPNIEGVDVPIVVAFGFRGALHLELFAPPGLSAGALPEFERELREALEVGPAS